MIMLITFQEIKPDNVTFFNQVVNWKEIWELVNHQSILRNGNDEQVGGTLEVISSRSYK